MINQAIIIDSDKANRESFVQQLSAIGIFQNMQFNSCNEADLALQSLENYQGIVFAKLDGNLQATLKFMGQFREKNNLACFIPLANNVSLEEMRLLIQNDVDQVLKFPFSESELKSKIAASERFRSKTMCDDNTNPSMPTFDSTFDELTDQFYRIHMIGSLVEICVLPEIKPSGKDPVLFIDCEHLRVINSVGIKLWLNWMKKLLADGYSQIRFQKLKPGYLQLASFVQGFIPVNGYVDSFYLHYVNDELSISKDVKFVISKDLSEEKLKIPQALEFIEDGKKILFQLDDSAPLILRFFKGAVQVA